MGDAIKVITTTITDKHGAAIASVSAENRAITGHSDDTVRQRAARRPGGAAQGARGAAGPRRLRGGAVQHEARGAAVFRAKRLLPDH